MHAQTSVYHNAAYSSSSWSVSTPLYETFKTLPSPQDARATRAFELSVFEQKYALTKCLDAVMDGVEDRYVNGEAMQIAEVEDLLGLAVRDP